jgi:hypothetical protein
MIWNCKPLGQTSVTLVSAISIKPIRATPIPLSNSKLSCWVDVQADFFQLLPHAKGKALLAIHLHA